MSKIKADEVASVLKKQILDYDSKIEAEEIGEVLEVGDGIARIYGLADVMANEMIEFENGVQGLTLNLEEDSVGAVVLGDYLGIHEGSKVKRLNRLLSVPVGKELIGRIVDPLGNPLDDKGPIDSTKRRPIEYKAPGIAQRQPVDQPLQTGIKAIDSMIPIGRGQRELIIGDRSTGKTAIALDTIINQKGQGVICVYVAVAQKTSNVAAVYQKLLEEGAMDYTIIVAACASDSAPLQYLAPYAGCAMAEYFMYEENGDTLCIYDDLSKHANAYRQLSLLLGRPPGREAYPGDVFYLHSRLLERAVKLSDKEGAGSLTALPIIETQEGEVSAYIPTNVISITDGQIYLLPDLFASGVRPAIDPGISVSRVGGKAQISAMKKISGSLRLDLSQYKDLEAFAQLGTELDKVTQRQLDRGLRLVEILKQKQYKPYPVEEQVMIIFAGTKGLLDSVNVADVKKFEDEFLDYIRNSKADILKEIRETKKINDEKKLYEVTEEFLRIFKERNK